MNIIKERTCNQCGRVHVAITHEQAEQEVEKFNEMYENLTAAEKKRYYNNNPARITMYENCNGCGNNYTNFRKSKENDCPDGVTLSPIIFE